MKLRIISVLALFLSIYFLPWWLTLLLVVIASFWFSYYWEAPFLIFILEQLYQPLFFLWGWSTVLPILTILVLGLVLIFNPLRNRILV